MACTTGTFEVRRAKTMPAGSSAGVIRNANAISLKLAQLVGIYVGVVSGA